MCGLFFAFGAIEEVSVLFKNFSLMKNRGPDNSSFHLFYPDDSNRDLGAV
ncbi:MAG: hypothetical protein JWQ79_4121 [Mucilaginibacter sp.]|nr:hypothetical protein [Mucilaginibacter sp.]